jgi:hypothetical protein
MKTDKVKSDWDSPKGRGILQSLWQQLDAIDENKGLMNKTSDVVIPEKRNNQPKNGHAPVGE